MDQKQLIRKHLLQQRKQMTLKDVEWKSMIIQEKLQQDNWFRNAKNILFYVSYDNEVSTHTLIKTYLQRYNRIIVPRSQIITCTIDPKIITSWDDLKKGAYGILEPTSDAPTYSGQLDLIIIPAVGFDPMGNRLGHGKGYYDRLINDHPQAHLIGLVYDFQIIDTIPAAPYDRQVHRIITEKRCIQIYS